MVNAQSTLLSIYRELTSKFPDKAWWVWEPETLLTEEGFPPSADLGLFADKVNVIQLLMKAKRMGTLTEDGGILSDPLFLMHACDVVNGEPADFDTVPYVTSLEVSLFVTCLSSLLKEMGVDFKPSSALIAIAAHSLAEDGFTYAVEPLGFAAGHQGLLRVPPAGLGSSLDATRVKAIAKYLSHVLAPTTPTSPQ